MATNLDRPKVDTVLDLYNALEELINMGKGHYDILMPEDTYAISMTINDELKEIELLQF